MPNDQQTVSPDALKNWATNDFDNLFSLCQDALEQLATRYRKAEYHSMHAISLELSTAITAYRASLRSQDGRKVVG